MTPQRSKDGEVIIFSEGELEEILKNTPLRQIVTKAISQQAIQRQLALRPKGNHHSNSLTSTQLREIAEEQRY